MGREMRRGGEGDEEGWEGRKGGEAGGQKTGEGESWVGGGGRGKERQVEEAGIGIGGKGRDDVCCLGGGRGGISYLLLF